MKRYRLRVKQFFSPCAYLIALVLLTSCAKTSLPPAYRTSGTANLYELKHSKNLSYLPIKGYQQTEEYSCGPAMVMSLLRYYHKLSAAEMTKATELRIAKEMGTSLDTGTSPQQIIRWLKRYGFKVKVGTGGNLALLQHNLRQGIPTLVEWIDWGGHWVIVAGYYQGGTTLDAGKDTIFFADSAAHYANVTNPDGITAFNADRFNSMWFDAQYFKPGHIVKGIYIVATPIIDKDADQSSRHIR